MKKLSLGKNRRRWLRAAMVVALVLTAIWLALPKPPLVEGIDFSTSVRDRNGNILRVTLTADQKYRIWTPLKEISPALVDATLRFEDKYYEQHLGVNPVALFPATCNPAFPRWTPAGPSTLTMHLPRQR